MFSWRFHSIINKFYRSIYSSSHSSLDLGYTNSQKRSFICQVLIFQIQFTCPALPHLVLSSLYRHIASNKFGLFLKFSKHTPYDYLLLAFYYTLLLIAISFQFLILFAVSIKSNLSQDVSLSPFINQFFLFFIIFELYTIQSSSLTNPI